MSTGIQGQASNRVGDSRSSFYWGIEESHICGWWMKRISGEESRREHPMVSGEQFDMDPLPPWTTEAET